MSFLNWINDNLGVIAGIIGSLAVILTAVFTIYPAARPVLINALKLFFAPLTAPWGIRKLSNDFQSVRQELSKEGGWISRDINALTIGQERLEQHRRHSFLIQPRPAFEMDSDANVLLSSGMAVRLFAVEFENSLRGLSYLQFIEPKYVDEFKNAFLQTARAASEFRFAVPMRNAKREEIGVFEWVCRPIGPRINGHLAYMANLYPLSETAKLQAARLNWSY